MPTFVRRTRIAAPARAVFDWHARPGAFERLRPPWDRVELLTRTGGIEDGARLAFRVHAGPLRVRWVAEHRGYVDGVQFTDVQVEGPFARWEHTHRVEPDGPAAAVLEDRIEYALPLGALGALAGDAATRTTLARLFTYRHRLTSDDLATHARYATAPRHVAVTGASGLVGSALVPFLTTGGHRVTRVVRTSRSDGSTTAAWDPAQGWLDAAALAGVDAVVHLAGESIAGGRWTAARKAAIRASRVRGTDLLCTALARLPSPPRTLVCASAIGFYGDRGEERLGEESAPGTGFLAEVCRAWEAATAPAERAGIRVVHLRLGIVLAAAGGALATMRLPFRLGAGGPIGPGTQYMSWIALDDVLGTILHVLATETLRGPVNAVAPVPVTNRDFTRTLAHVLHRPAVLPLPAAALRLVLGEMADEMLLASTRVEPIRLTESGYRFRHPELEDALRHTLGRVP